VNPWLLPLRFGEFPPIPLKPRFFEYIQNQNGNLWIWEKPLWKRVFCVEVTLVSKLHHILCLEAHESKMGRKYSFLAQELGTVLGLPDKSVTVTRQVWSGILSSTFDDCFEHNLLTVSLIDPILFFLGS
jgi:hypothetical protein